MDFDEGLDPETVVASRGVVIAEIGGVVAESFEEGLCNFFRDERRIGEGPWGEESEEVFDASSAGIETVGFKEIDRSAWSCGDGIDLSGEVDGFLGGGSGGH